MQPFMQPFPIPVVGMPQTLGPGSQQEDESLDYLPMPHDMHTYRAPILPEPEDVAECGAARAWLARLRDAARDGAIDGAPVGLDLAGLAEADRRLIDQVLGEGEVSAQVTGAHGTLAIQESVFAGVWRLRGRDGDGQVFADRVEVGAVPEPVRLAALAGASVPRPAALAPGVVNAPALLAEIAEQAARARQGSHVINLSLLPFGPEDAAWLDQCLGRGPVTLLSRGYGNCRITATGIARVWWVQYFNSQDVLILNTLEIVDVPEVACAAAEDLAGSAERLTEVLDWIG